MKNNVNALSIVILGVCFIIGCWLISNSFNENNVDAPTSKHQNQLLTRSELAEYLGISETDVDKLGPQSIGTETITSTTSEIPYVKIGNTTYFPVKAIDSWLTKTGGVTVQ
jgi:hypothetical protein